MVLLLLLINKKYLGDQENKQGRESPDSNRHRDMCRAICTPDFKLWHYEQKYSNVDQ